MTPAQTQALRALNANGGEGAISKHGYVVAGGEKLPFMADTWLRLVTTGHVEPRGPHRIGLTDAGRREATPPSPKAIAERIGTPFGRIEPAKGAE